jgi:DNA polymerase III sliding clamp (beta) subunit (PCNA family)
MTEFTIETPALRQALTTALAFASTDDTLPPINAVHIAVGTTDGTIEMAATDRYIMSVETLTVTGEPFAVTVPYDVAKRLLMLLPRPRRQALVGGMTTIARDGERVTVRLVGDYETTITFTPQDEGQPSAKFVNYREMLDKIKAGREAPADLMAFRPALLQQVFKALAVRTRHEPVELQFGGKDKPVLAKLESLTLVLMPVRLASLEKRQPKAEVAA